MSTVDKSSLRQYLLSVRTSIPSAEKSELDRAIIRELTALDVYRHTDLLLCFYPMRGEPDLRPLMELALSDGIPVALPVCTANGMIFRHLEQETALVPDRFGIPAPPPDSREASPTARTLCLLPGLAADRHGNRLGYGGGFYDRFLPHFEGVTLFPIYRCHLMDTLPHEAHDIPADMILTEKGVLKTHA